MNRYILLILCIFISFIITGCGGDNIVPSPPVNPINTTLKITINWPETEDRIVKVIPKEVVKIEINIKGTGIDPNNPILDIIPRDPNNLSVTKDYNLLPGRKLIEIKGLTGDNRILTHRIKDVDIPTTGGEYPLTFHLGVSILKNGFLPDKINIQEGDTLYWVNNDPNTVHTVTSDSNSPVVFDSNDIPYGGEFSYTFNTPGQIPYKCKYTGFTGSVIVIPKLKPTPTPNLTVTPTNTPGSGPLPTATPTPLLSLINYWGRYEALYGVFHNVAVHNFTGNVYIMDGNNQRVLKYNSTGTVLVSTWGTPGTGNGQFGGDGTIDNPYGIAVDQTDESVYVADNSNNRIQKFNSNGTYLLQWGSAGNADGQFNRPHGMAINSAGDIYVADKNNGRIQKFDPNGNFLYKWNTYDANTATNLINPFGVAISTSSAIYVTEQGANKVHKFSGAGIWIATSPIQGGGVPHGIAVDSSLSEYVYLANTPNNQIQKYFVNIPPNFNYMTAFTQAANDPNEKLLQPLGVSINSTDKIYVVDSSPRIRQFYYSAPDYRIGAGWNFINGDGKFNYPAGITIDNSGNVYVADMNNHRIQKFSSIGTFLNKWGTYGQFKYPTDLALDYTNNKLYIIDQDNVIRVKVMNIADSSFTDFAIGALLPSSIGVYSGQAVYVLYNSTNKIEKYTLAGGYITNWGSTGNGIGQFNTPRSLCVDINGNVYVADTGNNRIQKFDSSGNNGISFTAAGLDHPNSIAVTSNGNYIYVIDNNRLNKFNSSGAFIYSWPGITGNDIYLNNTGDIYITVSPDKVKVYRE